MSTRRTIYLPDELADRFDRVAKKNGLNASEFHQKAGIKYADQLEGPELTAAINAALDEIGPQPPINMAIPAALIRSGEWEW